MPKKMSFLHRMMWNAIKGDESLPEKIEDLGKPEWAKVVASIKERHKDDPEKYHFFLKTFGGALLLADEEVRLSPNKFDDAGLDIFLDPIREAAEDEGIEL